MPLHIELLIKDYWCLYCLLQQIWSFQRTHFICAFVKLPIFQPSHRYWWCFSNQPKRPSTASKERCCHQYMGQMPYNPPVGGRTSALMLTGLCQKAEKAVFDWDHLNITDLQSDYLGRRLYSGDKWQSFPSHSVTADQIMWQESIRQSWDLDLSHKTCFPFSPGRYMVAKHVNVTS